MIKVRRYIMHAYRGASTKVHAVLITSMLFASIWLCMVLTQGITKDHHDLVKNVRSGFGYPHSSWILNPNLTCNQPSNQSVLLDQSHVVILWTIRDTYRTSGDYIIFHDTIPAITISALSNLKSWSNNSQFSIPVDTSITGWHNYTLFFTDMTLNELLKAGSGASGDLSIAWVYVEAPPSINAPAELKIHRGAIGWSLNITITDPDSPSGWINVTRNGTMIRGPNLQWNNSQAISIPLITTAVGYFNFTISAMDHNYTIQQISIVWVAYNFPPEILGLHNYTVSPDAKIAAIRFRITDIENLSGNYTVLHSGTPFNNSYVNATWTNNTQRVAYIVLNTIGLSIYQVIAEDLTHNKTTSIFSIYINDPPRIKSSSPKNYTTPNGNVTWVIIDSDNVTGSYYVLQNGTKLPIFTITSLPWLNETDINISVSMSSIGLWDYTIVFTDGLSTRHDTIIISVTSNNNTPLDPATVTIILSVFMLVGIIGACIILGRKKK